MATQASDTRVGLLDPGDPALRLLAGMVGTAEAAEGGDRGGFVDLTADGSVGGIPAITTGEGGALTRFSFCSLFEHLIPLFFSFSFSELGAMGEVTLETKGEESSGCCSLTPFGWLLALGSEKAGLDPSPVLQG